MARVLLQQSAQRIKYIQIAENALKVDRIAKTDNTNFKRNGLRATSGVHHDYIRSIMEAMVDCSTVNRPMIG